jgi:hypothetical protein
MEKHDSAYYAKLKEIEKDWQQKMSISADHYAAEQREKINKINSIEIAFNTTLTATDNELKKYSHI